MRRTMRTALQDGLLVGFSVIITCFACEIAFRIWLGAPVLEFRNFVATKVVATTMGTVDYDAHLGWRIRPNTSYPLLNMSTLDYGVRKNRTGDDRIRTGGALVVGDSFAAGSEVSDDETWPAVLERQLGVPVINGAVGAYGTDQIAMRAEQLLPIVRPEILVIGMLAADIDRSGYSSFGRPKPYFTLDEGRLMLHNDPVPLSAPGDSPVAWWKWLLGHSYVADRLMTAIEGPLWYRLAKQRFARVANDQVEVTCRLLQRLKAQTDTDGIRTLLVMQHGGEVIRQLDAPQPQATQVDECARRVGIQVVDEFATLKDIQRRGTDALKPYYNMHGDVYGHMSPLGNALIASVIVAALKEPPAQGVAADYVPDAFIPGDGKNLIPTSEALDKVVGGSAIATFAPLAKTSDPRVYRLVAAGPAGEHYIGIGLAPVSRGVAPYTLSMEAKADGTSCLDIQILDDKSNGVIGEADLATPTIGAQPLGQGRDIGGGIKPTGSGWYRLWVRVTTASGSPHVILQLADSGCGRGFQPNGEAVLLRKIQLERGQSASAYHAGS